MSEPCRPLAQSGGTYGRRFERMYGDFSQLIRKTLDHTSDVRAYIEHRTRSNPSAHREQVSPSVGLSKKAIPRAARSAPPAADRLNIPDRLPYRSQHHARQNSVVATVTTSRPVSLVKSVRLRV